VKVGTSEPTYEIRDSYIFGCEAYLGGGIYLNNPEYMKILNTLFEWNKAENNTEMDSSGLGGGLYYTCTAIYDCLVVIHEVNSFVDNYADYAGGGIKWDDLEPDFDNTTIYLDNYAELYGDDVGAISQNLVSIAVSEYSSQTAMGSNSSRRLEGKGKWKGRFLETESSTSKILESLQSGNILPNIYIGLADKYGNIVGTDITSKLTVRVDTDFNQAEGALRYSPVLTGNSSFTAVGGVFNASDISFTGSPGFGYKIWFETDGIDNSKPSNEAYLRS